LWKEAMIEVSDTLAEKLFFVQLENLKPYLIEGIRRMGFLKEGCNGS
jgi:hypothetical protein